MVLRSAAAVENWDGDWRLWLALEDSWESGCWGQRVASRECVFCRDDKSAGRERGWGCSAVSASDCQLVLPGLLGRLK